MQKPLRDIRARFATERDEAMTMLDEYIDQHPQDQSARLLKIDLSLQAHVNYPFVGEALRTVQVSDPDEITLLESCRKLASERAWEVISAVRGRIKGRFGSALPDAINDLDGAVALVPDDPVVALAAALILLRQGGTTPLDDGIAKPSAAGEDDEEFFLAFLEEEENKSSNPFGGGLRSLFGTPQPTSSPVNNPVNQAVERYLRGAMALTQPGDRVYKAAVVGLVNRWLNNRIITAEALGWLITIGESHPKVIAEARKQTLAHIRETVLGLVRADQPDAAGAIIAQCEQSGVFEPALWLNALDLLADAPPTQKWKTARGFLLRLLPKKHTSPLPVPVVPIISSDRLRAFRHNPPALTAYRDLLVLVEKQVLPCRVCGREIHARLAQCPFCDSRQAVRDTLCDRFNARLDAQNIVVATLYCAMADWLDESGDREKAAQALQQGVALMGGKPGAKISAIKALLERLNMGDEDTAMSEIHENVVEIPPESETPKQDPPALIAFQQSAQHGVTASLAVQISRLNDEAEAWKPLKAVQRVALVRRILAAGLLRLARETAIAAFSDQPLSRSAISARQIVEDAISTRIDAVLARSSQLLAEEKPEAAVEMLGEMIALRDTPHLRMARAEARLALGHDLPALSDLYSIDRVKEDPALVQRSLQTAFGILERRWDIEGGRALLMHITDRDFVARAHARLTRRERGEPAIVIEPAHEEVTDDLLTLRPARPYVHAWFGLELREVGIGGDEVFYRRLNAAHIEFIQLLGAQRELTSRAVFALRFISQPNPAIPSRGRVRVVIMVRVSAADEVTCLARAHALWADMNAMLPLAQDNVYVYEPIVDETMVRAMLQPFEVAQVAEIVRRESGTGSVYSVSTFLTGTPDYHNVHWMLMRQPAPAMLSIQIMPTTLYAWERPAQENAADLNGQSDLMGLEGVTPGGASLSFMKRQLAQQQQWQKLNVADQRLTYLQNGFIMRVYVAGTDGTSQLLPEMTASTVFAPLQDNGFSGGYQVLRPARTDEAAILRHNLAMLDIARWDAVPDDDRLARLRVLVSEAETAAIFRLPVPHNGGVPGMDTLEGKALVPPSGMPVNGARLGVSVARVRGVPVPITQGLDDRRRHSYVVGKTGMGKSTLLQTLILQDIEAGRGVFLLDPHGDLCDDVLARIPAHRVDDVILFDPSDDQYPIGLNILKAEDEDDRDRVVSDFIGLLIRMYDPHNYAIVGPIFQQTVRNAMLAAMCLPDGTLVDVYRMISDQDGSFVKKIVPHITDPIVRNYWEDVAKRMREASSQWKAEFLPYVLSKFSRFVEDATLRRMIGQKRSGVPFDQVMDEGKILLVNLAKGRIGEQNALFIGSLILTGIMQAAFKRGALPPHRRRDYFMYIDEVQNFATPTLATMLSEGRKFGVVLTIANQYLHQLSPPILEAVFGNIGSIVAFRLGIQDVGALGMEFHPAYAPQELSGLPQFTAAVKLLIDGVAARPFTMRTLPSTIPPDKVRAEAIRAASQQRYGTPFAEVEEEIGKRFKL
jgi:hypothetical protein